MEQLIKRTHILKNLENKNSKMSIVKLSKNSHFFADFNLFDLYLKNRYTLAIISKNMPIIFEPVEKLCFRITLPIETEISGIVLIIFQKDNYKVSLHSECEQFMLFSYLDTIKNKFKPEPTKKTEIEVTKEKSEFLEDFLNTELKENFIDFEDKDSMDLETAENKENSSVIEDYEKSLLKQEYIINDPILKEDSTLGDNLEIANYNYFDENKLPQESEQEKMPGFNKENTKTKKYYDSIKDEFDELFNKNERETDLEKIISNSKFSKITYEKEKYYIVGIIFENNAPLYICYGVPSNNKNTPPNELKGFSSFVPAKTDKSFGYWMMYQDADTGETLLP